MNCQLHSSTLRFLTNVLAAFLFSFITQNVFSQTTTDSITVAIAPAYDSVGSFHRFWLGEGYRKLWAAPVRTKVLHLNTEKGGLTPVEMGGGFQTKSLRLRDASGKQWVLRSIQKYPERRLPPYLRNTIAQRILQDQVVTAHPYGAITVPTLASALNIVHTNPQVVYVADDPLLGKFRNDFANTVLLFEERGAIDTSRTINTESLQAEKEGGRDLRINYPMVLRARLLDMLVGDWDRHEGQWRWLGRMDANGLVFDPVPMDRDYVFYTTSGVLPWLVSQQYLNARFQKFGDRIRNVDIYNYNARFFDRYFLNALSEKDWNEQLDYVQKTLTDDVIRNAVQQMPDTVYKLSGDHIVQTLMARRQNLKDDALEYYHFISKYVDVPGTAGDETFAVEHRPGGSVVVTITRNDAGNKVIFNREFNPAMTKEIRLYGLGGNDRFVVSGSETSPIKIRMIGGDGKDRFEVGSEDQNKHKLFVYDRKDQENEYAGKATLRTSSDSAVNVFNRHNFKYDISTPIFSLFYNVDQRAFVTVGWFFQKNGFRKEPYASRHSIIAGYSPFRGSFAFSYDADWRNVFGKYGLNFNLTSLGPKNLVNFFGLGNETPFPRESNNGKNILYYRNRYDIVHTDLRIKRYKDQNFSWSAGLTAQYYHSSEAENSNRFLGVYNLTHPDEKVFTNRVHAGVAAGLEVDTRTHGLMPSGGIYFTLDGKAMEQLRGEQRTFGSLRSEFSLFTRLSKDSGVVLVNRVGGGTTFGDPLFYQMMNLGGALLLRGYNTNRFTGRSMLYHSAELRLKLFHFTSYLFPGTVGLIGFNDVGRVWMPGETSTQWHDGYGGGIYILPADVVMIRAVVGHSAETTQVYFNLVMGLR
jgi:hypothetical protein